MTGVDGKADGIQGRVNPLPALMLIAGKHPEARGGLLRPRPGDT